MEGIELIEVENAIHIGMMGLHGGTVATGVGTCRTISASTIGVVASSCIINIVNRFEETFGTIDCLRLCYNQTQRAFDFLDPDARFWEMPFIVAEKDKCGFSTRDSKELELWLLSKNIC